MTRGYGFQQSPNYRAGRSRSLDALVLHFTASPSLESTVKWFLNPQAGASAHYVVGRDGRVVQMVHETDTAWHAGEASLEGNPKVNSMSIGIEMVNWGRLEKRLSGFYCWPKGWTYKYDAGLFGEPIFGAGGTWWAPYPERQLEAVEDLSREIVQRWPAIVRGRVVGHSDVAPGRKTDPGPAFSMDRLRRAIFDRTDPQVGDDCMYRDDQVFLEGRRDTVEPERDPDPTESG